MFNGQRAAPTAPAPESLGHTSPMRAFARVAHVSEDAKPTPTPTPPAGDKSLGARTIFRPGPGAGRRSRLTLQQQAVIAVASALAFAATIGVGLAFTMRPARVVPAAAAGERPAAMLVSPGGYPQIAALRPPTVPPLSDR
jgi:hypothetical protein